MVEVVDGKTIEFGELGDSMKTGVLMELTSLDGEKVGGRIIDLLTKARDIDLLVLAGMPASGKTTIWGQLNYHFQHTPVDVNLRRVAFDDARTQMIGRLGDAGVAEPWKTSYWDVEDWNMLSDNLTDEIAGQVEEAKRLKHAGLQDYKIVAELVAIGEKNRGITTLTQLSERYGNSMMVVFVLPDPGIFRLAAMVRNFVEREPSTNLKKKIDKQFGIVIGGYDNSAKAGRQIKELFAQMAHEEHIEGIKNEVVRVASKWYSDPLIGGFDKIERMAEIKIADDRTTHQEMVINEYILRVIGAYMEYTLRELNTSEDLGLVAVNRLQKGKKIYMRLSE